MKNPIQKIITCIGVLLYVFLGIFPISSHAIDMATLDMHQEMMNEQNTQMAMGDCSNSVCIQETANDCLEHCLQAATTQAATTIIPITVSILIAIIGSILAFICIPERIGIVQYRHWYRPLYIFTTVQLLE